MPQSSGAWQEGRKLQGTGQLGVGTGAWAHTAPALLRPRQLLLLNDSRNKDLCSQKHFRLLSDSSNLPFAALAKPNHCNQGNEELRASRNSELGARCNILPWGKAMGISARGGPGLSLLSSGCWGHWGHTGAEPVPSARSCLQPPLSFSFPSANKQTVGEVARTPFSTSC